MGRRRVESISFERDIDMQIVHADSELRSDFDKLIRMEKRLTEIRWIRKCEKYKIGFEEERQKASEFEKKAIKAEAKIEYLEGKLESSKQKMATLREKQRKQLDALRTEKSSLFRENGNLREKIEDCYAERDRHATQQISDNTRIERLEEDKRDLEKKKIKCYVLDCKIKKEKIKLK